MTVSISKKNFEPRPRLHWLMYGLYYPAILGAAIVFTLQHLAKEPVASQSFLQQ